MKPDNRVEVLIGVGSAIFGIIFGIFLAIVAPYFYLWIRPKSEKDLESNTPQKENPKTSSEPTNPQGLITKEQQYVDTRLKEIWDERTARTAAALANSGV